MPERLARVALACLVEPGAGGIAERVAELGPEAVLGEVLASPRRRPADSPDIPDIPAMLASLSARGIRVVVAGDPEYPSQLLDLPEPPMALWVRGPLDLRIAALRSVAVVGSRSSTAYGERATAQVVEGLAERGWTVVSGAAFGIDAAAHRAALGAEGATIAVLACGVDVAYPRSHDALLSRIADVGAVISELPPGSLPLKHRFLARNRVIAALSRGTVVVEAARRSGALATASRAMELGRVLMAVPGPITSMASSGTNRLLHEQSARAVATSQDVIDLVVGGASQLALPGIGGIDGPSEASAAADRTGAAPGLAAGPVTQAQVLAELGPEAAAVLGGLSRRAAPIATVARAAGVSESACAACLGLLELSGLARRTAFGWRR